MLECKGSRILIRQTLENHPKKKSTLGGREYIPKFKLGISSKNDLSQGSVNFRINHQDNLVQ